MSAKKDILAAIRRNRPGPSPLPEIARMPLPPSDELPALFSLAVEKVGGEVVPVPDEASIGRYLAAQHPEVELAWCHAPVEVWPEARALDAVEDPHQLDQLQIAVFRGHFGVAENGAIWITEQELTHRAAPYITQQLGLIVPKNQLLWNMHQAYERLGTDLPGFGVFIAGPSKTADIEQSLVLGAHGPVSLRVFLVG
jgi:L-lactate dehydrogenase complex protein LldG